MTLPPTLPAYEREAERLLSPAVAAFLFGGAGGGASLRANRQALDGVRLVPRAFGTPGPAGVTLFGDRYAAPILVAPMGYQRLFHPDGETASARAAAALGLGYVLPTLSSVPMEQVAAAMQGAPHWFQLYLQPDPATSLALVRRAEACGARAIVVTVDAPVDGVRDRQAEAGFTLPPDIRAVHLAPPGTGRLADRPTQGWADVARICRQTALPVIAKGIMHPLDAARALDAGCRGVIVSNHGGRVLDGGIGALDALPAVVARVGGRVPVLFDSGIRRGTDIAKALHLGAQAVLAGRPVAAGLALAGDRGAAHVLRLLTEEWALATAIIAPE